MHLILLISCFFYPKVDSLPSVDNYFFPEYEHYYRPNGTCDQNSVESIWGAQYLKIVIFDSCRYAEVSCYRSADSTLKEKGIYLNTNKIVEYNSLAREGGGDKSVIEKHTYLIFKRKGVWKFYNRSGKVIKMIKYK